MSSQAHIQEFDRTRHYRLKQKSFFLRNLFEKGFSTDSSKFSNRFLFLKSSFLDAIFLSAFNNFLSKSFSPIYKLSEGKKKHRPYSTALLFSRMFPLHLCT